MNWLVLCFVGAVASIPLDKTSTKSRYEGFKVLSINPRNEADQDFVHSLSNDIELDFWKESSILGQDVHIMVPPHSVESLQVQLRKKSIPFSVHIEDLQPGLDRHERELEYNKETFDYEDFNTLTNIYAEIDRLSGDCPSGCSCGTRVIGKTHEKRDLTVLSIVCNATNPSVWIDSAIHAREWLAPATVFKFIQRLWNGDDLLQNYNFDFLPVMNPDGYEYTWTDARLWRKNRSPNNGSACVGTDLNRNYATNWDISGTSPLACSDTYAGSEAGSELETKAVQSEILRLENTISFVSVHCYGNYWLHPWGHQEGRTCQRTTDHEDLFAVANASANAAAAIEKTEWLRGNSCETIYPASGLTIEYAYSPGGIKYAYTPELRGGRFDPPASEIGPSDLEFHAAIVAQLAAIQDIEAKKAP